MNMGIYIGWFIVLIVSEMVADVHMTRNGGRGFVTGILGIAGAFLSWAFIPVSHRLIDVPGYVNSAGFNILLGIGILGISLFMVSCLSLINKSSRILQGGAA